MTPTRTIIVGDIHGMHAEMLDLFAQVSLTHDDHLVLAGDLLDKGPESALVVRTLRKMEEAGQRMTKVLGNHEKRHGRFRAGLAKSPPGVLPKMTGAEILMAMTDEFSPADIAFLDSCEVFARLPEHGALVVHGGILPSLKAIPSEEEIRAMPKADLEKLERCLRLRHVRGKDVTTVTVELRLPDVDEATAEGLTALDELVKRSVGEARVVTKVTRRKGEFLSLGEEGPDDPLWAEVYDGRFGHVYFGHSPMTEASAPVRFPHATALDLGCVYGNLLAAVVLEEGKEPRFVTVRSRGVMCAKLGEE